MSRPWDSSRHAEIAAGIRHRLKAGSKLVTIVKREPSRVVAVRRVGGIVIGYWAGPRHHVNGKMSPVKRDKAYANTERLMIAALQGCDLEKFYQLESVS
jgi:hypothetical protein